MNLDESAMRWVCLGHEQFSLLNRIAPMTESVPSGDISERLHFLK